MSPRKVSSKVLSALARVCASVVLALFIAPAAGAYEYSYARAVRLSLVDGDVQVARPDTQGWEPAIVNLPIQQGFSIATGQGRAEIEFESGATARLAENSLLQFTELALSNGARITKLTLTQGTGTFYANLSREDSFVVATPQLHASMSENARFRVDVLNDGSSVSVLKGEVDVDSRAGTHRVTKGHTLTYSADDTDNVRLERNAKADEWDRWVADRDEVVHAGNQGALRYVSSPYSYGLADLYRYGTWFSFGSYGLGWRPYGVGSHWSPFWDGRWVSYPGLGLTWVSYEPWGWLPYHFGRWIFSPTFGWVWVPGFSGYWQPAVVSWVRLRNCVGWVPLSPHDRPGQTPTNLQHGVITTSNGFIGADPDNITGFIGARRFERRLVEVGDNPEAIPAPRAVGAGFRSSGTSTPNVAPAPSEGSRDTSSIVFDPRERKFVNRSTGPVRSGDKSGDAHMQTESAPRAGAPATAAPPTRPTPLAPIDRRGSVVDRTPASPRAMRDREVAPRMEAQRPAPPPRVERPPTRVESPRPTPRAETPRVSPPPRMESPRMSSPPPAPRPMPRAEPRPASAPRPQTRD